MERPAAPAPSVPQTQQSPGDAIRQVTVRGPNYTMTFDTFETALQKVPAGAEILSYHQGIISYRLPNPNHALPSSSIPAGVTGPGLSVTFPTSEYLYGRAGAHRFSARNQWSYRSGYGLCFASSDELRGGFLSDPVYAADLVPPSFSRFMEGPTAEQSTDLTKADAALAAGRAADAAALYELHLKQSVDESQGANVRHGLALIESGRVSEGIVAVYQAYELDHGLADNSLRLAMPEWSDHRIRTMVSRVVGHANRNQSASSWLVVALLMEAEGRASLANQMLDRSIGFGLDQSLGMRVRGMIAGSMPKR